ncbi:MAG: hypothetical protein NT133_11590 [Alphaproteobacteria bacterium]|nr:hypothetical protein [Alphaproteobacteria bacterium]
MIINRRALLAAIGLSIPGAAMAQTSENSGAKKRLPAKKTMKPASPKTAHKAPKAKTSGSTPTQG